MHGTRAVSSRRGLAPETVADQPFDQPLPAPRAGFTALERSPDVLGRGSIREPVRRKP